MYQLFNVPIKQYVNLTMYRINDWNKYLYIHSSIRSFLDETIYTLLH